mmetsp:Transcript_36629/g.96487  ORF Transcript_36629/g.96487 Transcript_36629/m.96487 type:complete len:384 (-) Transcript_36629:7117-8268(-)
MAHRKFEAPRHGSLGFLPKKRCKKKKGVIKSFPAENTFEKTHITAFIGYKAGMTHVIKEVDKPGSKLHKKDVIEAATVVETPPLVIAGIVGYVSTPKGLKAFKTIWSDNLSHQFLRNYYKNWYKSKKKAFSKYFIVKKKISTFFEKNVLQMKKFCKVFRFIVHPNICQTSMKKKKAEICEIQVNGGSIHDKISFCLKLLGNQVTVNTVFKDGEYVDTIAITKGKGFTGVVQRWGVTKLPRKTRRGARKVACIGSWHPSRVSYSVPRAGQKGYHHRTQSNIQVYKIGKSSKGFDFFEKTPLIQKNISPIGGFPYYGIIKTDFIMFKGCITGSKRRTIIIKKKNIKNIDCQKTSNIILKFIDTSSKWGHGRFQTSEEKRKTLTMR